MEVFFLHSRFDVLSNLVLNEVVRVSIWAVAHQFVYTVFNAVKVLRHNLTEDDLYPGTPRDVRIVRPLVLITVVLDKPLLALDGFYPHLLLDEEAPVAEIHISGHQHVVVYPQLGYHLFIQFHSLFNRLFSVELFKFCSQSFELLHASFGVPFDLPKLVGMFEPLNSILRVLGQKGSAL